MIPVYAAGLPVDCPENRAFVAFLGVNPDDPRLWLKPYPHSVRDTCQIHQGPVWLGPLLQRIKGEQARPGLSVTVLCLICAVRLAGEYGVGIDMVPLSNKQTGPG